jgi:hypothetical protein
MKLIMILEGKRSPIFQRDSGRILEYWAYVIDRWYRQYKIKTIEYQLVDEGWLAHAVFTWHALFVINLSFNYLETEQQFDLLLS